MLQDKNVEEKLNFLFKFDDFYFLQLKTLPQKIAKFGSFGVKTC